VGQFGVALAHLQTEPVVWTASAVVACSSVSMLWTVQVAPWLWAEQVLV